MEDSIAAPRLYDDTVTQEVAEARGRAMIRPWRVGLLAETSSATDVRNAIAALSSVWGGRYMPILDIGASTDELKRLGATFDVDSLYADVTDGPLGELLREPGWAWRGRGVWGPFGGEAGFRKGLLPIRTLLDASTNFIQPVWNPNDPADLILAATWGLEDNLGVPLSASAEGRGPRTAPFLQVATAPAPTDAIVGTLELTGLQVRTRPRAYLDDFSGVYVVRPDHPLDTVEFWNMRTYGTPIIGVPSDGAEELRTLVLSAPLPSVATPRGGTDTPAERALVVWGLEDSSEATLAALQSAATRDGLEIVPRQRGLWRPFVFQGLQTSFTRSVRTDFRPAAQSIDVALPVLPLRDEPDTYTRGVVAAEVNLYNVSGQDPRLTAQVPPYRRHSSLLTHGPALDGVDHVQVTQAGVVLGIDVNRDHVQVPFAYNQDAMRLLFDDDSVTVTQSDIGKFQSRAAEKFGGPFSGVFNQPGIRAAIELAAGREAGLTLPHLRQVVERKRGSWPDTLFGPEQAPESYARRQIDRLFYSGIFVPTLRVHCSHCRVERHISADGLANTMICEFCGQAFSLALSHSLTQPEWRYRLAAHLRADQVQALLPALATASLLRQLRHIEEPPLPHVLGLEVKIDQRKVEVDVAVYLPDRDWTVVLGEVKTGNRIDANDVGNLEFLRQRLLDKDVHCLALFATLKSTLSPEEVTELRGLVERSQLIEPSGGGQLPNMPLVLTGPDLSHPPGSEQHPWRWDTHNYSGVFGSAITSCERNLGLVSYELTSSADGPAIRCEWGD